LHLLLLVVLLSQVVAKKYVDPYPARITNFEADSVTNYWIEYGQTGTHHELITIAKATKDDTTYYYAIYYNNGNRVAEQKFTNAPLI